MEVQYRISGTVNGQRVDGTGRGKIDAERGQGELEVRFDARAEGWDPRTIILMCCSRAYALGSVEVGGAASLLNLSGGVVSIGRHLEGVTRHAAMVDDHGRLLADISASSMTSLVGQDPFDESIVHGRYCDLEPGRRGIAAIRTVRGMMLPVSRHLVSLTTTYDVVLETGESAHGFTHYPHYLPAPAATLRHPQAFQMDVSACEWTGTTLRAHTCSRVSAVTPGLLDGANSIEEFALTQ